MSREQLLDYNESLCRQYNETEDPAILEQIAATEVILFYGQRYEAGLAAAKEVESD